MTNSLPTHPHLLPLLRRRHALSRLGHPRWRHPRRRHPHPATAAIAATADTTAAPQFRSAAGRAWALDHVNKRALSRRPPLVVGDPLRRRLNLAKLLLQRAHAGQHQPHRLPAGQVGVDGPVLRAPRVLAAQLAEALSKVEEHKGRRSDLGNQLLPSAWVLIVPMRRRKEEEKERSAADRPC